MHSLQNANFSLSEALSLACVAAVFLDDDGSILELNEFACVLLGCASADAAGETLEDLMQRAGGTRARSEDGAIYRLEASEREAPVHVRLTACGEAGGRFVRIDDVSSDWRVMSRLSAAIDIRDEMMRQAAIGSWRYDPDTGEVELDEVQRARRGATTGKTTLDRALGNIHPDDRKLELDAREYVCRTGGSATATLRLRDPGGGWNIMRVHSVAGRKAPSGLHRVHSMCEDVTTLVETQGESVRNAKRLEMALIGARSGVFEVDMRTDARWESPYFIELIGPAALERSKDDPFLKYHDDDVERVRALATAAMKHGGLVRADCRIYNPGKEDFWVRLASQVECDENGEGVRVVGVLQDINDAKKQELAVIEARREAEAANERLSLALNAAHAGVFEVDLRTEEAWASPNFWDIVGEDARGEMRAGHRFGLYHLDDRPKMAAVWSQRKHSEDLNGTDARLFRKDGVESWVRLFSKLEFDEERKPVRAIGMVQDINQRKREETALVEAMQAAEAATVAKGNFLASMSHEIRTPLNGVLGMAQVLELGDLQDDQREHVATIMDCGKSLMALLNDVLDISKISAGKLDINPVEGDLTAAVRRVQQLFAPGAGGKGLKLDMVVEREPPSLEFDPVRVRQCLSNLVSNAVKFTERGGVQVVLDGEPEGDGYRVRIRVRDTGIGIEPAIVGKLFEPFTQADESTTRQFGGTGLGLSIARDLAQLMGGDISVSSQPGEGAEFTLSFWCSIAAGTVEEELPIAVDVATTGALARERTRVLLVDDNPVNRKVARIFLRAFAAEVVEAADGVEALGLIETEAFDLVLLDVHMPVMDGREVIARVRGSDEAWSKIPVIALTAHAMEGDAAKFLGMGMDDYISKPIDQRDFNEKVMRVLSRGDEAASTDRLKFA